jgi:hypothetical protein
VKNVINNRRVVDDGVFNVSVCSLIHLLVASKHDVEGIRQGNVDSTFEVVKDVIFTKYFVGCVQRNHDQGDVFF